MRKHRKGLSLIEAMILLVIMSVVSLGVGAGLRAVTRMPEGIDDRMAVHIKLIEKLEELKTLSFALLNNGTNRSDTVTIAGQTVNRTVTIAQADADGANGVNADFLQITVTINGSSLATRVCQP